MQDKSLIDALRVPAFEGVREDCPDPALVAAFSERSLPEGARKTLSVHLAGCLRCREDVAFLIYLDSTEPPDSVSPALVARVSSSTGRASSSGGWRWTAAAAILLAAVLGVTFLPRWSSEPGAVRGVTSPTSAPELLGLPEGTRLDPSGLHFRWSATQGADYYTVRIVTEEGDLVWEGSTEAEQITVPAGEPLIGGASYYVRVSAHVGSGTSIDSAHHRFEIRGDR